LNSHREGEKRESGVGIGFGPHSLDEETTPYFDENADGLEPDTTYFVIFQQIAGALATGLCDKRRFQETRR
jgi:hypothetical protein